MTKKQSIPVGGKGYIFNDIKMRRTEDGLILVVGGKRVFYFWGMTNVVVITENMGMVVHSYLRLHYSDYGMPAWREVLIYRNDDVLTSEEIAANIQIEFSQVEEI